MLIDAIDDKVHTCGEWCSDFICYKYEATSCKTWYCENLFLKEKKKDLLKMTDEDLPSVLQEMGVSSFTLDDGSKVEIKPLYAGHISANNKEAAFEWLRNNGHDDIIKNVVSCQFGRGEDNKAEEFYAIASAKGYVAQQKQDVHASTLKAWIRERVENGEEFPMEVFGAYISQRATIKGGK